MIEKLALEVHRLDPDNPVLAKYLAMDNFEGAELRKSIGKQSYQQTTTVNDNHNGRMW